MKMQQETTKYNREPNTSDDRAGRERYEAISPEMSQMLERRAGCNLFAQLLGIRIVENRKGYSECELEIREEFLNPFRVVHGGCIYTLADVTVGNAASSYGILSLVLFMVPAAFEDYFKIQIPPLFQGIIYLFIYAAEILGEINHYYVLIPGWDTILHTLNGFLCAALGFSMVYLMNRNSKYMNLSPFYLTLMAFCFSMTVGVIWEFIEFNADSFLLVDMQKDHVITRISSAALDPEGLGKPFVIKDITETVIKTAAGEAQKKEKTEKGNSVKNRHRLSAVPVLFISF